MTVTLPPELEGRVRREAERYGLDPADYAKTLIEKGLARVGPPDQATLDLLAKWDEEDRTDDPAEIQRRRREFEEFKEGMNRNRLESDGPDARIPYP